MAIEEKNMASKTETPSIEVGTYKEDFYKNIPPQSEGGPVFVVRKTPTASVSWWRGVATPPVVAFIAIVLMVGVLAYSVGATMTSSSTSGSTTSATTSSMSNMQ